MLGVSNFLFPAQRHAEWDGAAILDKRHRVYEAAKAAHPERWNGRATRDWSVDNIVYLNPEHKLEKS